LDSEPFKIWQQLGPWTLNYSTYDSNWALELWTIQNMTTIGPLELWTIQNMTNNWALGLWSIQNMTTIGPLDSDPFKIWQQLGPWTLIHSKYDSNWALELWTIQNMTTIGPLDSEPFKIWQQWTIFFSVFLFIVYIVYDKSEYKRFIV